MVLALVIASACANNDGPTGFESDPSASQERDGVTSSSDRSRQGGSPPPDEPDETTWKMSPESPAPGEQFTVDTEGDQRGFSWRLEVRDGAEWRLEWILTSDALGDDPAAYRWQDAEQQDDRIVDDLGIAGPSPDRLVLPERLSPGIYRLVSGDSSVAPFEVTAVS